MMDSNEQAWNDYYDDFMKRKNEIISKLTTIKMSKIPPTYEKWIDQVIEFIKERRG